MRGPTVWPAATARSSAASMKNQAPASRTVVKPASRVARALAAARSVVSGWPSSMAPRRRGSPAATPTVKWVWRSISPGSRVTSPSSTFGVSAGSVAAAAGPA